MDKKGLLKALGILLLLYAAYFGIKYYFFPPQPPAELAKPRTAAVPPEVAEALLAPHALPLLKLHLAGLEKPNPFEPLVAKEAERKKNETKDKAAADAKAAAEWKDDAIELGAESGYKLRVRLSKLGAAVRSIQLNNFKAADRATARPIDGPLMLIDDDMDGDLAKQDPDKKLERQSYRLLVDGAKFDWKHLRDLDRTDEKGILNSITFAATPPGKNVRILKTFSLAPGDYHIGMDLKFEAVGDGPSAVEYTLTGPRSMPVEGEVWKSMPFRQVVIGTMKGSSFERYPLLTAEQLRSIAAKPEPKPKLTLPSLGGTPPIDRLQYCGVMLQYFAALVVVDSDAANLSPIFSDIVPEFHGDDPFPEVHGEPWPINRRMQGRLSANLKSRLIKPTSGEPQQQKFLLYAGPTKVSLLQYEAGVTPGIVSRYTGEFHLDMMTDASWSVFFRYSGWTALVVFFTDKMHWLLVHLSWLCGGQHWAAIILMTVLVRGLLFPISRKQALMSLRMQKMGPEMKKLQEKYKDDKQSMAAAQMELYRKHGVNPFGGCLVMLLQMPVLMGLYYALYESVDLRLSSFLWIENLAAPDMLIYWGRWSVPIQEFTDWWFLHDYVTLKLGPYFNILPILSTVLLVIQQKFMTPPPADEQQAQQQKMMKWMMILMGYAFYWVAAGLCIYFIISGSWGMLERKLLPKLQHDKPAEAVKPAVSERRDKDKPSRNGTANGVLGKVKGWITDFLEKAKKK